MIPSTDFLSGSHTITFPAETRPFSNEDERKRRSQITGTVIPAECEHDAKGLARATANRSGVSDSTFSELLEQRLDLGRDAAWCVAQKSDARLSAGNFGANWSLDDA